MGHMGKFEAALRQISGGDHLWGEHLKYILSGNERGAEIVDKMVNHFVGPLEGRRVLDIGCGYGGVCISAAKHGAFARGIEVGSSELEHFQLNLEDNGVKDVVNITFGDADDIEFMASLGKYDLVICDNVLEHVPDSHRLIYTIAEAMNEQSRCYVTVPNYLSLGQVLMECHNREFGLSLLNRFDAQELYEARGHYGRYSVGDYFDYNQYLALFAINGINAVNIVPIARDDQAMAEALDLLAQIKQKRANMRDDIAIERRAAEYVDHYIDRVERRLVELERSPTEWRRVEFFRDFMVQRFDFVGQIRTY
ncbi:class I SAM-dependent methyltransferase [Brevundimonas sp. UBA5866]|nr:class I SAM-dependent methyltransferase [Brevundimonas sp. UBA5866]